jgi:beta-glucosidase
MKNIFIVLAVLFLCFLTACDNTPVYKNASAPVEKRVKDLLKRMTVEEKIAQMDMLDAASILGSYGRLSVEKMDSLLKENTFGSIHDFYPVSAELCNEVHRYVMENSRLGIPPIMIEEALHGYQGANATLFPIPLGSASAWDTTLVYRIGRAIGAEARAHGIHLVLSPNLDLAREPRWGRVEET